MTWQLSIATIAVSSALLAGCAGMGGGDPVPPNAFRLSSPSYADNSILPRKHAGNAKENANCIGDNVSPAMQWSNAPAKTKSFALIMDDQAGQAGLGVSHWVAYGIPANVNSVAEGETTGPSPKYVGGTSTRKLSGYFGPCTPKGNAPQHYVFTMIATDLDPAELKPGLTRPELLASVKGHALGAASMVLRFVNP
jgi:Raf kinase inhibitor-like YbhB/YbcL family protein